MSLLEVVIATFVLSVAIVALAGVASASLVQIRVSRDRQAATDAATSRLEQMRLGDFSSVAMLSSDVAAAISAGDLPACAGTVEPYVETTDTDPDKHLEYELADRAGPLDNIRVRTIVTWYDDPGDGDDDCTSTPREVKRVRVEATWTDGAAERTVVEETLVSPANRGLPLPSFRLENPALAEHWTSGDLAAPAVDREKCLTHRIRNVGAPDRYEVLVERTDAASTKKDNVGVTGVPFAGAFGYDFSNAGQGNGQGKWFVRAELVPVDPPGATDRWIAAGSAADRARGDDSVVTPTGGKADLLICYTPTPDVELSQTFSFKVTVFSRFDQNEFAEATHTLTTGVPGATRWFLFDTDDTQNHGRPASVIYSMGPEQFPQPSVLGTTGPFDYDTGDGGYPGIRLENDGIETARWHEQVSDATDIAAGVEVVLWVSLDDALDGDPVPSGGWNQTLLVDLRVLKSNESTLDQTPVSNYALSWSHVETRAGTDDGWVQVRATLPNAAFTIKKNHFLQLRLRCAASSADDCEILYDHVDYPSRVEVVPS